MNATPGSPDKTATAAAAADREDGFLVVGIGASAGGVEALKELFRHVPRDSGAAYVVILHLSPDHESRLAEILEPQAQIPIQQVRGRVKVEPNRGYVVPPNQNLSIQDGHLTLSAIASAEERRAPVDMFFRTLGESQGSRALGVVLSGTGSDGASGIKRVKECGGICIVQDPTEALHDEMPRHAIDTELVDDVLLVSEMPARIIAYQHHRTRMLADGEARGTPDELPIRDILAYLRLRTGHDFTNYKRSTLIRRIQRRVAIRELANLAEYAACLRDDSNEGRALLKDLLISVTNFFRDAEAFKALEVSVIPELFRNKTAHDDVRVWVAGCATGEEVYTIAMLLCEHADGGLNAPNIQVFATDIDERALAKARAGFYTTADVASISPERLRRFFVPDRDGYRVRPELREMVLFATHNLLKHPPYAHIDLIACRNLLIYVNRQAQRRVIDIFHFALNANGFLFLGTSESIDDAEHLFRLVNREARIFQRTAAVPRSGLSFAELNLAPDPTFRDGAVEAPPRRPDSELSVVLHQRLLEHYAPPSVVVNARHDVIHLSDSAGEYMRISGGELTNNVIDLVRPELQVELRTALFEAARNHARVMSQWLRVTEVDNEHPVRIIVSPPIGDNDADAFTLVLFERQQQAGAAELPAPSGEIAGSTSARLQLDHEVSQLRAQLRSATEQHELHREELKASNEELQSINEELRSTSEELETGKEELQSYNEELSTVNQELKVKIDELTQANNDARNLMNSTDTATVFLDRSNRIKRFTPRANDLFRLLPTDIGRPLSDLRHALRYDELALDVKRVLDTLQTIEREVQSVEGHWFIAKVLPYRTDSDRIEGVVLTFIDITARKGIEDTLRVSEEQFRRTVDDAPIPVIMHAEDGEVLQLSRSWTRLTGYSAKDLPTFDAWLSRAYGEGGDAVRDHMRTLFEEDKGVLDIEFTIIARSGEHRQWSLSASSPGRLRDGRRFIIGMAVDVTERKRAAEALVHSEERLRLMLQSVTDYGIFTTDARGIIVSWHPGAERLFEYPAAEAIGRSAAIIFTSEDRDHGVFEKELQQARDHGSASDERWHVRKSGERFFASGVVSSIRNGGEVLGYIKVARDLTAKRMIEEALRQARDELEERVSERTKELAQANEELRRQIEERIRSEKLRARLLGQLVDAQESERRRLSRELHDQLGQQVTALLLKLAALKSSDELASALKAEVEGLETIAKQLDSDVDHLAWELRPTVLDDLGFAEALHEYLATWTKRFGIPVDPHISITDPGRLSGEIETMLYRITQEALNNVAKHAAATTVDVIVDQRADQVSMIIEDDGTGFDVEAAAANPSGLGLAGMRERAALAGGSATIESRAGQGTTVFVRIPMP